MCRKHAQYFWQNTFFVTIHFVHTWRVYQDDDNMLQCAYAHGCYVFFSLSVVVTAGCYKFDEPRIWAGMTTTHRGGLHNRTLAHTTLWLGEEERRIVLVLSPSYSHRVSVCMCVCVWVYVYVCVCVCECVWVYVCVSYLNIISIKSSVDALHYFGTELVTAGSASNTF